MFKGDKKKTAEFCIEQFDKFLKGIREWNCDGVSYAEIHAAALFLSEDEDFEKILRRRWSDVKSTIPPTSSNLDFAMDVAPDLISGFFHALIEYMETYRGNICGG